MDKFYREYSVLFVEQKEIVKERLIATVVDSLDSLSDAVCGQLLSIAESYQNSTAPTATQANQELMQARDFIQRAGQVYEQQLACSLSMGMDSLNNILPSTADSASVAFNQPTSDISTQVNVSINQSNDTNDGDSLSVASEINSQDECFPDSQPDADVKEGPDESQTETEINQSGDTATVNDENVSNSECETIDNSNNQDLVVDDSLIEESANITKSDGNVETVDSNEACNEHPSGEMLMDGVEIMEDESQDGPTITLVNFEEFEAQFLDNSHNQHFLADGLLEEEAENVSSGNTANYHLIDSNEDNDHSSGHEALDEQENSNKARSEQDPAGPPIVANTGSTLTCPSTRPSTKVTLTGTLKGKRNRAIGPSDESTAHKRSRIVPAPTVAPEEADDSEDGDAEDPEPEDISPGIIVRHLKCHVPDCTEVFPGKVQLDDHHLTKHAIEKYACKVRDCTVSYATWSELSTHLDTAHDNLDNNWPCAQCKVTCTSYPDLYDHTFYYHE